MNAYALQRRRETQRRTRLRAAGKLPPLPRCERCGHKVLTDRWLPLCFACRHRPNRQPRALRLAAEQVLEQLRCEPAVEPPAEPTEPAAVVPLAPLTELRGAVADQTLLDYLDLATIAPEPGTVTTSTLRELWRCSQSMVSRRLAAVREAGLAEISSSWSGYQVHAVRRWEVVA